LSEPGQGGGVSINGGEGQNLQVAILALSGGIAHSNGRLQLFLDPVSLVHRGSSVLVTSGTSRCHFIDGKLPKRPSQVGS
jgi:hypothetical protein